MIKMMWAMGWQWRQMSSLGLPGSSRASWGGGWWAAGLIFLVAFEHWKPRTLGRQMSCVDRSVATETFCEGI